MPKRKSSARPAAAPIAKTIRALARAIGCSPSTVHRWRKRPEWTLPTSPPWRIADVKAWCQLALNKDNAAEYRHARAVLHDTEGKDLLTLKLKAEIARLVAQAKKTELERSILDGQYHPVAECAERRLRQIHAVRKELEEAPRSLAPRLAQQDRPTIQAELAKFFDRLLKKLAGGP